MKKYWFKRKRYGWGWTPSTWQGWTILLFFVALIALNTFNLDPDDNSLRSALLHFIPQTGILVIVLIAICFWKGEPPKWQWGEDAS